MTVQAILNAKGYSIVAITPEATLKDAVSLLAERRIGALLVMSGESLDGILSERDIVRAFGESGAAALDLPVHAFMTRKVMTCSRLDTVAFIMERMTEGKFRHLPVVESGRVAGIISIGDVVKQRVMEFEKEHEALRDYIATA